jgi:hypothetical protein
MGMMAKKSRGFAELLKQKHAERTQQNALEKLQKKVQQGLLSKGLAGTVANPQGEVKMSEVLEEFVEPYLDFARNRSEREKLFSLAVVAWNLALIPENERQQIIEQGTTGNDPLARQDAREFIDELIARKKTLFAENKRYIVEFQLQDTGKTLHLSVASTL